MTVYPLRYTKFTCVNVQNCVLNAERSPYIPVRATYRAIETELKNSNIVYESI